MNKWQAVLALHPFCSALVKTRNLLRRAGMFRDLICGWILWPFRPWGRARVCGSPSRPVEPVSVSGSRARCAVDVGCKKISSVLWGRALPAVTEPFPVEALVGAPDGGMKAIW